jgi:2-polyprenyl-6-methoxyphenol hydroxylase-like FAD-dependent oxidoreductase
MTVDRETMTGGSDDPADGQYGVSRIVLRRLLLTGLDHVIHYGSEFDHYTVDDGAVTAHFADGTTATGDILVGADGANSRVCAQYLPGAARVDTDAAAIAGRLPLTPATRAWLPESLTAGMVLLMPPSGRRTLFTSAFAGREQMAKAVQDGELAAAGVEIDTDLLLDGLEDYVLWGMIAHHADFPAGVAEMDGAARQVVCAEMAGGWDPVLARMIMESRPESVEMLRLKHSTLLKPWPSTTVTVLGDAVHNMPPVGGLGANSALLDAAALAEELLRHDAPVAAIAAYEKRMRDHGYGALRESVTNTRRAITPNVLSRRMGRLFFRGMKLVSKLRRRSADLDSRPVDVEVRVGADDRAHGGRRQ